MKNYGVTKIFKETFGSKLIKNIVIDENKCDFCDILYGYICVALATRVEINK